MATTNSAITFKGNPLTLVGKALKLGDRIPEVTVTGQDMTDYSTAKFSGKPLIVSLVPSLDTSVCSIETKRFNQEATKLGDKVAILTLSKDLPFAQKRWCAAEGATNLTVASDYKLNQVGQAFGAYIQELGLLARAVFVTDSKGVIVHLEYVSEVTDEPDYDAAFEAVSKVLG